jgi:hypothetical protein
VSGTHETATLQVTVDERQKMRMQRPQQSAAGPLSFQRPSSGRRASWHAFPSFVTPAITNCREEETEDHSTFTRRICGPWYKLFEAKHMRAASP